MGAAAVEEGATDAAGAAEVAAASGANAGAGAAAAVGFGAPKTTADAVVVAAAAEVADPKAGNPVDGATAAVAVGFKPKVIPKNNKKPPVTNRAFFKRFKLQNRHHKPIAVN